MLNSRKNVKKFVKIAKCGWIDGDFELVVWHLKGTIATLRQQYSKTN